MPIGFVWQTFLVDPLTNLLVLLSVLSFGSFGLGILLFTALTRVITFPLTMRTMKSTKAMQELQPKLQEIQKKYSDPKRRSEETMKLYREGGVNPLGCLGPMVIQFPIFIALFWALRIALSSTPEGVLQLQSRLYDVGIIQDAVPLSTSFLFIDLSATGNTNLPLFVIVFASSWLQQRISSARNLAGQSDQQRQMNTMMQWMFPAMIAWFTLIVPAGLGLYWAATTIIGILLHWAFIGPGDFTWGSLIPAQLRRGAASGQQPVPATQPAGGPDGGPDGTGNEDEQQTDEQGRGDQRSRRRRSRRQGARAAGSQSQSGRRRRRSRR
jgi:YidC/Oxa1 family membrane protein insertase